MKRIEYLRTLNTRKLANEFYYFNVDDFIQADYQKTIKNIMKWLNEQLSEVEE